MDNEIEITYLNNMEKIIQYNCESNKRFNKRIEIIKILEKKNIKWKEANKLGKIWYNITYNKCKYNPKLYKLLNNLLK